MGLRVGMTDESAIKGDRICDVSPMMLRLTILLVLSLLGCEAAPTRPATDASTAPTATEDSVVTVNDSDTTCQDLVRPLCNSSPYLFPCSALLGSYAEEQCGLPKAPFSMHQECGGVFQKAFSDDFSIHASCARWVCWVIDSGIAGDGQFCDLAGAYWY